MARIKRNLVICLDGTGNEYGAEERNTNVVKLFSALDRADRGRQIAYYDPGVGTLAAPGLQTPFAKVVSKGLGLAFGLGMTRNIEDAYRFLMSNYRAGDRIFVFGFSRGAYSARALIAMLHKLGLLHRGSGNLIPYAVKLFRRHPRNDAQWEVVRGFRENFARDCKPHFIGVWDTVKSVGWLRRRVVLDFTAYNPDLRRGRHAVSIDERRSQYRTNLWRHKNGRDIQQVWFAGVHSDVGGSYPEHGLSDITLKWMLDGAIQHGLLVDDSALAAIQPNPLGKLHDPLIPFWWVLGWNRRSISAYCDDPDAEIWIHESVRQRMQHLGEAYRPDIPPGARFVG